jgi:hypothetical protein
MVPDTLEVRSEMVPDIVEMRSEMVLDIEEMRFEMVLDIVEMRSEMVLDIVEMRFEMVLDIEEMRSEMVLDIVEMRSEMVLDTVEVSRFGVEPCTAEVSQTVYEHSAKANIAEAAAMGLNRVYYTTVCDQVFRRKLVQCLRSVDASSKTVRLH